jgi:hypothetical protein
VPLAWYSKRVVNLLFSGEVVKAVNDAALTMNKLAETKAMMEATRLLMDEAINKPVVVDWLEGTK